MKVYQVESPFVHNDHNLRSIVQSVTTPAIVHCPVGNEDDLPFLLHLTQSPQFNNCTDTEGISLVSRNTASPDMPFIPNKKLPNKLQSIHFDKPFLRWTKPGTYTNEWVWAGNHVKL